VFACAVALTAPALPFLRAETEASAGRALVKRYADAIVSVELVVTMKLKAGDREMPPREQKVDVNGTVISATGLTVTSLAEVDPQTTFEAMRMNAPGGARVELLGADFKEVKLRRADGTEVPARFVLKDGDLDLAFIAPEIGASAAQKEFSFVNLAEKVDGGVLDAFYFVARAPKVLQRVPLVRTTSVMGVVEKPRRFYLLTDQGLGTPVFDGQGRVLGISLQHFANGRRTGIVALPADDIAEIAKQAAAAQAKPSAESASSPSSDSTANASAAPAADAGAGEKK